jgi:hypothetical protein
MARWMLLAVICDNDAHFTLYNLHIDEAMLLVLTEHVFRATLQTLNASYYYM